MVARPTVLCIDYDPPPEYFLTELNLAILDKVVVRDDSFSRCLASAETVLRTLGPDAADLVWHLALQRHKAKLLPHVPESSDEDEEEGGDDAATEADALSSPRRICRMPPLRSRSSKLVERRASSLAPSRSAPTSGRRRSA